MTSTVASQHHERDYRAPDGRTVFHILIDVHPEGSSVQVSGHPTLDRQFTCWQQRNNYLRLLRDEAHKGTPVWQIEHMAGALTSAAAIVDDAEQDLVDRINADLDEQRAKREQDMQAVQQLVEDALGPDRAQHATWRDHTRKQVTSQANATQGRYARQVKTPLTGADAELSTTQLRALTLADINGEIRVQPGVAVTTLQSLARKGLGRLVLGGRTRYSVVKIVLSESGLNAAMDAASVNGATR